MNGNNSPELWTIQEIVTGKKNLRIPKFQRKYVWKEKNKNTFIDSILKKYPSNYIIVLQSHDSNGKTYHDIIDGVQRINTLIKYYNDLTKFDMINEIIKKNIIEIVLEITDDERKKIIFNDFKKIFKNLHCEDISFDIQDILIKHNFDHRLARIILSELNDVKIDIHINMNVLVCRELDTKNLYEIFERLNTGGIKLTNTELYAVQWNKYGIIETNNMFLKEGIKNFYENFKNDNEISIENIEKSINENQYSYYELFMGISDYLKNKELKNLFDSTDDKNNVENCLLLIYLCLNKENRKEDKNGKKDEIEKKLEGLPKIFMNCKIDINDFMNKLIKSIGYYNNFIENKIKYINVSSKKKTEKKISLSKYVHIIIISYIYEKNINVDDIILIKLLLVLMTNSNRILLINQTTILLDLYTKAINNISNYEKFYDKIHGYFNNYPKKNMIYFFNILYNIVKHKQKNILHFSGSYFFNDELFEEKNNNRHLKCRFANIIMDIDENMKNNEILNMSEYEYTKIKDYGSFDEIYKILKDRLDYMIKTIIVA